MLRSLKHSDVGDKEIFSSVKEGNEQAYYELFDRYWEKLYTIAKSILQDADLGQDLVQEVFIDLWERKEQIENENIGGYLNRAIRFKVYKALRDGKLNADHLEFIESIPTPATLDDIEYEELQVQIEQHISELPERCAEVFRLSRYEHLSNREIAEKLQLSQRTVETHISNAIKVLREKLSTILVLLFLDF